MEYGTVSQPKFMHYSPIVRRITGEAQEKAIRLWDRLSPGGAWDRDRFDTEQAIKEAITRRHCGGCLRPDPNITLPHLAR
jgi:hypothetical protein